MSESSDSDRPNSVDLTPSPRILRMLGEIAFEPWQCIAELVDNSIDAFLSVGPDSDGWLEEHNLDVFPIHIGLPSQREFESGLGKVTVEDLGPGMSFDQLNRALKAGFSSNNAFDNLGLFGMGFNVATARLGSKTTVRSTRLEDPYWIEVEIDFGRLIEDKSFIAPVVYREKLDNYVHGTVIEISKLKSEFKGALTQGAGRASIRKNLSRIYSSLLSDQKVALNLGELEVLPWQHCIWDPSRTAKSSSGVETPCFVEVNHLLPQAWFCNSCWSWTNSVSGQDTATCEECGPSHQLEPRERRIKGWLGIQRFFDMTHYGIDFIRNGRVIEKLNKDVFYWTNDVGEKEKEYPIDTKYWGGRIVGQIHLDFARVNYMKTKFDDELSTGWKEAIQHLRGVGPLRPKIARDNGFPENDSPLSQLYATFRSGGKAGRQSLVLCKRDNPSRGDNADATNWAIRFWAGEEEFQSDEMWWSRVILNETVSTTDEVEEIDGADPFGDSVDVDEDESGEETPDDENSDEDFREFDREYSREYVYPDRQFTTAPIRVLAYIDKRNLHRRDLKNLPPLDVSIISPREIEICYHPDHPAFTQFAETPHDYILLELAGLFAARATTPVSSVYQLLKLEHQNSRRLDLDALGSEARAFLSELREFFSMQRLQIPDRDRNEVYSELATHVMSSTGQIDQVEVLMTNGQWVDRVSDKHVLSLIQLHPEIIFDRNFLDLSYQEIPENLSELRDRVLGQVMACVSDLILIRGVAESRTAADKSLLLRAENALQYLKKHRSD